jgi:hypothetical protein
MTNKYILDKDGIPIPIDDPLAWANYMEGNRIVRQDETIGGLVSTVFLGIDHNWFHTGPPPLWETMIFDADDGREHMERYSSLEDAKRGHRDWVMFAESNPNRSRYNLKLRKEYR